MLFRSDFTFAPGPSNPNISIETLPQPPPFDPSGYGGGALTFGPYLGATGPLVSSLLKSKKIRIGDLLTGAGKNVSAIATVLQRRLTLG